MRFWLNLVAVLALVVCPAGAWAKSTATTGKDPDSRRTLAAGHGRAKEARGGQQDPTDAELMLDAVNKWRGETPDAAKIEKISAEAQADAKREQVTLSGTWKDPFAEDPERAIPFQHVVGKAKGLAAVRRELARARAETAAAQADAATAHADAAKAKANLARVAAAAAWVQAVAAKHEATAARAACVDPGLRKRDAPAQASRSMQTSRDEIDSFAPPKRHARVARTKGHGFASNAGLVQASSTGEAAAAPPPPPPVEIAPEAVPPAPVALSSTHGGILVVPITR